MNQAEKNLNQSGGNRIKVTARIKEETIRMAMAIAPVSIRVSVPICAVASKSSLSRDSMVLYIPAPGTSGRIPGMVKIREASLKTLAKARRMRQQGRKR